MLPREPDIPARLLSLLTETPGGVSVPAALCTVVAARGSTPQKAGAKMIALGNAEAVGTIGGGCVEAEVRRRAVRLIAEGRAEVAEFSLDSDYGWDDGLICGGSLRVLVEPLSRFTADDVALLREAVAGRGRGLRRVMATVVRDGPAVSAGRFLLEEAANGEWRMASGGAIDGAFPHSPLATRQSLSTGLAECLRRRKPVSVRLDSGGVAVTGLGEAAESAVAREVFLEPVLPRIRLVIAGAGHVGQALAGLAAGLDFETVVIDDRDGYANPQRFPVADRLIVGDIPRTLADMEIGPGDYVVVVTRGHKNDADALFSVIRKPAGYLGLIGSRRKIKLIFDGFRAAGVPEDAIARVHAPIGLDIGSETVAEIAVSIAAELVAVRAVRSVARS
jgi:xanthine dehydrogenase accessory factor